MFTFFTISVNCGEGEVAQLIQKERESLRPDQFFDVDMVMVPYIIMIMFIMVADDHDMWTEVEVKQISGKTKTCQLGAGG